MLSFTSPALFSTTMLGRGCLGWGARAAITRLLEITPLLSTSRLVLIGQERKAFTNIGLVESQLTSGFISSKYI